MAHSIIIPNGIASLSEVDFKCPRCNYHYTEENYSKQLNNSKHLLIYKTCKECKSKMGITIDFKGDVRVWLKENEPKIY